VGIAPLNDLTAERRAAALFTIPHPVQSVKAYGHGLIHRTFVVQTGPHPHARRFLLQEINKRVFPDPQALMENVNRVLSHLRSQAASREGDDPRGPPDLVQTRDGGLYLERNGRAWRMMKFLENTVSVHGAPTGFQSQQIGWAFGQVLEDLSDLPVESLHPLVPDYRNTQRHLSILEAAAAEDRWGRRASAQDEVRFFCSRSEEALFLQDLWRRGDLPVRAVHGDTKLDNVLLDDFTDRAVCVVDLDTVSAGLLLHDLSDALRELLLRTAVVNPAACSEAEIPLEAFLSGFLGPLSVPLSSLEEKSLVTAVVSMALELGIRFLGDYLCGDVYFQLGRGAQQSLRRARQHRILVQWVDKNQQTLRRRVDRCVRARWPL
jgi:Ser/Thr protein kinase RdoA (MazF antagonist)